MGGVVWLDGDGKGEGKRERRSYLNNMKFNLGENFVYEPRSNIFRFDIDMKVKSRMYITKRTYSSHEFKLICSFRGTTQFPHSLPLARMYRKPVFLVYLFPADKEFERANALSPLGSYLQI